MDHIIGLKQAARMRISAATAAGCSSSRQRTRPSTMCICALCLCFVHCTLRKAYYMLHQDHWGARHAHARVRAHLSQPLLWEGRACLRSHRKRQPHAGRSCLYQQGMHSIGKSSTEYVMGTR